MELNEFLIEKFSAKAWKAMSELDREHIFAELREEARRRISDLKASGKLDLSIAYANFKQSGGSKVKDYKVGKTEYVKKEVTNEKGNLVEKLVLSPSHQKRMDEARRLTQFIMNQSSTPEGAVRISAGFFNSWGKYVKIYLDANGISYSQKQFERMAKTWKRMKEEYNLSTFAEYCEAAERVVRAWLLDKRWGEDKIFDQADLFDLDSIRQAQQAMNLKNWEDVNWLDDDN